MKDLKHLTVVSSLPIVLIFLTHLHNLVSQSIPMFLPIMRGTLNLPAARDPEILERLDPGALYRLCHHYQQYLHQCANLVANDQTLLNQKIKEVCSTLF